MEKKDTVLSVAMVALPQAVAPAASDVAQAYQKLWDEKITGESDDDLTFSLETTEGQIICGLMPVPLPWTDLEGPCATSPFWEDAAAAMKKHKAHLIVTASPVDENPVAGARLLTKAIAAVLQATSAIGVYCGAGTLVHSSVTFLEHAAEMSEECLPLYLWVDFRVMADEGDTVTLFTTGMEALGFREMEIVQSQIEPAELVDLVFNFAHYLLDNGPVIADGDTIGMSETQEIKIRHVPSIFEERGNVCRLEL
jgi:hypothetical protein